MKKSTYIIIGVIVVVLFYGWTTYNGLVTASVGIDGQWAQVETQYQRRFDLIPNLVESVKGIMIQEQTVFTAIAEARTKYSGAMTVDEKARAAGQVESALGRLLVITENYPQLKSSETVQTLMSQLEGTENRVAVERKRFNDAIASYNLKTKRFPSSLIASLFGFGSRDYFEAAAGAENAPKVSF
ncbi:MAG: LemA protein [Parcubacteria group bacterium GW2011_GWA2_47_16]|nr:MAG: LemA protein [Parcubacteria group bacterium GW2011_GWA2_47_16]